MTAASLWFRNNVSPPGCLTIGPSLLTILSQWHGGHKFWGGVRKNCEGAGAGRAARREEEEGDGWLPNLVASRRGFGLREVSFAVANL